MSLPTELRLKIFESIFDNLTPITLFKGSDTIVLVNSAQTEPRDLGNKSIHHNATEILKVSRQFHDEAEDVFYNRTLFGIIASPYQEPAKLTYGVEGLKPMPNDHIPVRVLRKIKRLLFVMHLRGPAYTRHGYRVADLRYLQAMENLKEIRIVFTNPKDLSYSHDHAAPIQAIVESVPPSARVRFGPNAPRSQNDNDCENVEHYPGSPGQNLAMASNDGRSVLYTRVEEHISKIDERRGVLSGSKVDHSLCTYKNCIEGKRCVNSEMETPPPKKQKALSKVLDVLAMKG